MILVLSSLATHAQLVRLVQTCLSTAFSSPISENILRRAALACMNKPSLPFCDAACWQSLRGGLCSRVVQHLPQRSKISLQSQV